MDLNVVPVMATPERGTYWNMTKCLSVSNKMLTSGGCFPFTSAEAFKKHTKPLRLKMELISIYAAKCIGNTCKYLRSDYERALTNIESINSLGEG